MTAPYITGVAVVVFDEDNAGYVALGRRNKEYGRGLWVHAGGKMEPGETPEEAARREVREEFGCEVEGLTQVYFEFVQDVPAGHPPFLMLYYTGRAKRDSVSIVPDEEFSDLKWFNVLQLPSRDQMWSRDFFALQRALAL